MKKDFFLEKFFANLRHKKAIRYIPKNSVVCDIGCGYNAEFLKKIEPIIKYGFGFDKDVQDFKDGKLELKKFKIFDKIPLPSARMDAITALAILEHLEKPQEFLSECFRILKKGGVLILTTPTPRSKLVLEFLAFRLGVVDKDQVQDHLNYFWPNQVKQMLSQSGFNSKAIKGRYFGLGFNSLIVANK